MVKHIILWTLKETDADKKAEILANMKEHLEGTGTSGSACKNESTCVFECGGNVGYDIGE